MLTGLRIYGYNYLSLPFLSLYVLLSSFIFPRRWRICWFRSVKFNCFSAWNRRKNIRLLQKPGQIVGWAADKEWRLNLEIAKLSWWNTFRRDSPVIHIMSLGLFHGTPFITMNIEITNIYPRYWKFSKFRTVKWHNPHIVHITEWSAITIYEASRGLFV